MTGEKKIKFKKFNIFVLKLNNLLGRTHIWRKINKANLKRVYKKINIRFYQKIIVDKDNIKQGEKIKKEIQDKLINIYKEDIEKV